MRVSQQCRCIDTGKSGVAALRHGVLAVTACRTPCRSVGQKSLSSRSLLSATHAQPLGTVCHVSRAHCPAIVHMSKTQVSGPAPGTRSPRSGQGEPSAPSHCARAIESPLLESATCQATTRLVVTRQAARHPSSVLSRAFYQSNFAILAICPHTLAGCVL